MSEARGVLLRAEPTDTECDGWSPPGLRVRVCRNGDSGSWLLDRTTGSHHTLLGTKQGSGAELTSNAMRRLPHVPESVEQVTEHLTADEVLLIGTGGFGDPLGRRARPGRRTVREAPHSAAVAATDGAYPGLLVRDLRRRPDAGGRLAALAGRHSVTSPDYAHRGLRREIRIAIGDNSPRNMLFATATSATDIYKFELVAGLHRVPGPGLHGLLALDTVTCLGAPIVWRSSLRVQEQTAIDAAGPPSLDFDPSASLTNDQRS